MKTSATNPPKKTSTEQLRDPNRPQRRLGGLTLNQFATLICHEYIRTREQKHLNFLRACWPAVDWLAEIEHLKNPDHRTLAE